MTTTDYNTTECPRRQEIFERPTFAEFFAGIGLMRMGLEQKGWQIAFANDIAEDKYAMYTDQFADANAGQLQVQA